MSAERWPHGDWQRAKDLLAHGFEPKRVAQILNRKVGSVLTKMRYEAMTPEQRRATQDRVNANRRKRAAQYVQVRSFETVASRPTADILAERDRYLSAPRTLTQSLLGDPPPGYSALDRKRQEART